jgi:superfamily II DNA or RNA helicase
MTKREEIQNQAASIVLKNNFNGILLDICPRLGKTLCFIKAIANLQNLKILILVPEIDFKDTWNAEFKKWNYTGITEVECFASLDKVKDNYYDIVWVDEVHLLSFAKICILAQMRYKNLIKSLGGMSGSISNKNKKDLKQYLKLEVAYTYSIRQGIKDGIIADYRIILCPVKLLKSEKEKYDKVTKEFEDLKEQALKNPRLNHIKKLVAGKRARMLYGFKSKINAVKKLVDKQERCMVFTCLTEVAESISDAHHGSNKKLNNLELFKQGTINKLAVAKLANAGVTIPNLKVGIIHQLQSNENTAIQRILRMCNLDGNQTAYIYIFYYEETVDFDWVSSGISWAEPSKIGYLKDCKL